MICVLWLSMLLAGKPAGSCRPAIPSSLGADLRAMFPDSKLLTTETLDATSRREFLKQHPDSCPGVATGDFFGDGRPAFALVLCQPLGKRSGPATFNGSREAVLVVARPDAAGKWWFQFVEGANDSVAVVESLPPGDYASVYADRVIHAQHEVIGFGGFDSWYIALGWNGSSFEKVWLVD
jgi:hypothetical protein